MICIVNISPPDADPLGWNEYEVRINNTVIGRFNHKRSEGLSKCLLRASDAAKLHERLKTNADIVRLIEGVKP